MIHELAGSKTMHTLLEGIPHDIEIENLVHNIEEQFQPVRLHHVHVWQIGPGQRALTAHFDAGNLRDLKDHLPPGAHSAVQGHRL